MNLRKIFLILTSLFLLISLHAEELSFRHRTVLMTPLFFDGRELGGVWFYPAEEGKNNAFVDASMLLSQLRPFFDNAKRVDTFLSGHPNRFYSLEEFDRLNLQLSFDEDELVLRAKLAPEMKGKNEVSLESSASTRLAELQSSSFFSAYSNFYFSQGLSRYSNSFNEESSRSSFVRDPFYGTAGIGIGLGKYTLLSDIHYREGQVHPWQVGETEIVRDLPSRGGRLHLGEFSPELSGFQQDFSMAGVMLHRVVQQNPALASKGRDQQSLMLREESVVEVLVNGAVVHKERYPAGPISFSHFPFASGVNNLVFRITDMSGKVEEVRFSQFFDNELLAKGDWEYSVAHGTLREDDGQGRAKYDEDWSAHSSYLRYGFSRELTVGVNFQRVQQVNLLGGELTFPYALGIFENHLAYSVAPSSEESSGHALRFSLRSFDAIKGVSSAYNYRLSGEWFGEQFAYSSGTEYRFSLYASRRLPRVSFFPFAYQASIGAGISKQYMYEDANTFNLRSDLSLSIERDWNIAINLQKNSKQNDRPEWLSSVNLIWSPQDDRHSIWANYDSAEQDYSLRYRGRSYGETITGKYDARVGDSREGSYAQVDGGITGQRGELSTQYSYRKGNSGNSSQYMNLESRTALAFAGGQLAWGRHVGDSFAILGVDAPKDEKRNFDLRQKESGRIIADNSFGPILLGDISPYIYREFSFDSASLKDGESLSPEIFALIPEYKKGHLLMANFEVRQAFQAIILNQAGRPLTYLSGAVLNKEGKMEFEFFSNRHGRIFAENLRPGTYLLRPYDSRFADYEITLPQSKQGIIDLGTVRLELKKKDELR